MHRLLRACLALLLVAAAAAQEEQEPSVHHIVCTADAQPLSSCQASAPASTYSGFDVDLFRRASLLAGWVESSNTSLPGVTWEFKCMDFGAMIADLTAPNGTCTVATAGITISSEREAKGITFSDPTYRSSLAIMVHTKEASNAQGWFFLKPFSWQVWLAIVLTVAAVPLVTFFTEFISLEGRILRRDLAPGMKEASWRSMWCMLLMEPFQVTAVSSRIVAIVYGFIATVLINTYCANLAAALTVSQLDTPINSVDDLRGKAVGTISVYIPRMNRFGIAPTELPFETIQDAFDNWIPKLRSGVLVATAVDEPVQQYLAAQEGCDLQVVSNSFAPFDYGLAWRTGADPSDVRTFDDAILQLQEDSTVTQLRDQYITVDRSECESGVSNETAITFDQVSGLWIIMALAVAISLVWLVGLRVWKAYKARCRQAAAAARQASLGGKGGVAGGAEEEHSKAAAAPGVGARQRRHRYKPGVAFRQAVSMFGAQIGGNRADAAQAAAEQEQAAWLDGGGSGSLAYRGSGGASAAPSFRLEGQPPGDQSVAQLLAHVRALCDRLEAWTETSYQDGTQRVVDERIEEAPDAGQDG